MEASVTQVLGGLDVKEAIGAAVNYLINLLTRNGYLLDRQINAVEKKHQTEEGYRENLIKKRLAYKKSH